MPDCLFSNYVFVSRGKGLPCFLSPLLTREGPLQTGVVAVLCLKIKRETIIVSLLLLFLRRRDTKQQQARLIQIFLLAVVFLPFKEGCASSMRSLAAHRGRHEKSSKANKKVLTEGRLFQIFLLFFKGHTVVFLFFKGHEKSNN